MFSIPLIRICGFPFAACTWDIVHSMAALALRVLLLSVLLAAAAGEEASKHVVVTRVARELDLTSHLAKQIVRM